MENDFDEIDRFAGMTVEEQATKVLASFDGVGSPGGRQASLDGSSPLSRKSGGSDCLWAWSAVCKGLPLTQLCQLVRWTLRALAWQSPL